jgi:prepilin-type processing-associated H-X9-DG protein
MCNLSPNKNAIAGFNRMELMIVIVTVGVLAALGFFLASHRKNIPKEVQCADNLKQWGLAMSLYEQDNDGRLPFAFILYDKKKPQFQVWDQLIFPYVSHGSGERAPKHIFRCPSDTLPGADGQRRRSYSMPWHNMNPEYVKNWPPGPTNSTGVGLWWQDNVRNQDWAQLANVLTTNNTQTVNGFPATPNLPAVRLNMIPKPGATLLLTEQMRSNNIAFNYLYATIRGPSEHVDKAFLNSDQIHGGKFNYLMVDGHVELFVPTQTLGQDDPDSNGGNPVSPDIWTIRPDD